MKCRLIRIFLAWSIVAVVMISVSALRAGDFKTTTGEEFKNATINRIEPDGIVITYSAGIVKLPFTELSKELQDKYHYDPKAAADFRRQIDEAKASRDGAVADAKEKARQFNQSALPSPAATDRRLEQIRKQRELLNLQLDRIHYEQKDLPPPNNARYGHDRFGHRQVLEFGSSPKAFELEKQQRM